MGTTKQVRNLTELSSQLEEIKNDLEIVKNRVSSLDRISVLGNRELILDDLRTIVASSTVRAAILANTAELISAASLAEKLSMDPGNLSRQVNRFTGKKGYINSIKRGRNTFYIRDEKIDLLNIDQEEPFKSLYDRWLLSHQQDHG